MSWYLSLQHFNTRSKLQVLPPQYAKFTTSSSIWVETHFKQVEDSLTWIFTFHALEAHTHTPLLIYAELALEIFKTFQICKE